MLDFMKDDKFSKDRVSPFRNKEIISPNGFYHFKRKILQI